MSGGVAWQETWRFLDREGKGVITIDDMKASMNDAGIRLAHFELREMMQMADANGDGEVPTPTASPHTPIHGAIHGAVVSTCTKAVSVYTIVRPTVQ